MQAKREKAAQQRRLSCPVIYLKKFPPFEMCINAR
jgi:hypothetical protein